MARRNRGRGRGGGGQSADDRRRERGHALFEEGRVEIEHGSWPEPGRSGPVSVVATVYGSRPYRVEVEQVRGGVPEGACSCPDFDKGVVCKHLWALAFEAAERLGAQTSPRPRPALRLVRADEGDDDLEDGDLDGDFDDEDFGDDDFYDVLTPEEIEAGVAPGARTLPYGQSTEARVAALEQAVERTTLELSEPAARIEYVVRDWLDPATIRSSGGKERVQRHCERGEVRIDLRVTSAETEERSRPLLFRTQVAALPLIDRQALGLYASNVSGAQSSGGALRVDAPWVVPGPMVGPVLRLLAETGRLRLLDPYEGGEKALAVDLDEPYRFSIDVRDERRGPQIEIAAWFRRGDERIPTGVFPGALLTRRERDSDRTERAVTVYLGRAIELRCDGARALVDEFAAHGTLTIDRDEAPRVLGLLARTPAGADALGEVLEALPIGTPEAVVALGGPLPDDGPFGLAPYAEYRGWPIARAEEAPVVRSVDEDGGAVLLRRDREAEDAAFAPFDACGLEPAPPELTVGESDAVAATIVACPRADLEAVVERLRAAGVRVFANGRPLLRLEKAWADVRSSGIDWFDLEAGFDFGERTVGLPELLDVHSPLEGFVELGDGSLGLVPSEWLRRIQALRLVGEGERGGSGSDALRVPSCRAAMLDVLLERFADGDAAETRVDAAFARVRDRLRSFETVAPRDEPEGFEGELRPYQRRGLGWLGFLRDVGLGGCLADDMGLGKTVQVLAHLAGVAAAGRTRTGRRRRGAAAPRPSLLVAPRSVLSNWISEAARFTPGLRVLDFGQADRWQAHGDALAGADLVLTTYALLRADAVRFADEGVRFDTVILDEAQAIKNPESQTAKAARVLEADHRLALSGTPIENHLGELWSLYEFLQPGLLGRNKEFRTLFSSAHDAELLERNRALVQGTLRPVMLRRTKAEVLDDLPDKVDQVLWCELDRQQRRRYDQLRDHFRRELLETGGAGDGPDGVLGAKKRFVVLEALLRLRQAACHEGLLDPTRRKRSSAKFDALVPRLEELAGAGHKVLVFSQFVQLLDLLVQHLDGAGIRYERLDGRTRDRAAKVARFQEGEGITAFLISLKAGGSGLNLTAASHVFLLDPWWNPAVEQQAIDRAHRIGQTRVVHAFRMACRDTVEERVLELQERKRALFDGLIGQDRSLLQDLTRDDLATLLA